MPNFFSSPQINPVSQYEPPGYGNLRGMLLNRAGQRNMNPFGIGAPYQGSSQYNPYGGRGQFNPYSGGYGGSQGGFGSYGGPGMSFGQNQGGGMWSNGPQGQYGGGMQQGGYPPSHQQGGYGGWQGPGGMQGPGGQMSNQGGMGGFGNLMQLFQQFMQQRQQGMNGGMGQQGQGQPGQGRQLAPRPPIEPGGGPWTNTDQGHDMTPTRPPIQVPQTPTATTEPPQPAPPLGTELNPTPPPAVAPPSGGGAPPPSAPPGPPQVAPEPQTEVPRAPTVAPTVQPTGPPTTDTQDPNQQRGRPTFDGTRYDGAQGNPTPSLPPAWGQGGQTYTGPMWSMPGGGQAAAQAGVQWRQNMAQGSPAGHDYIEGPQTGTPPQMQSSGPGPNPNAPGYVTGLGTGTPPVPPPPSGTPPPPTTPPSGPPVYDGAMGGGVQPQDQDIVGKLLALLQMSAQHQQMGGQMGGGQPQAPMSAAQHDGVEYDGTGGDRQPYPDESSPMPYDGQKVGGRVRAPLSTPPGPQNKGGPKGLQSILGGMQSANRRGTIEAAHVGRPGVAYDATNPTPAPTSGSVSPFPTGAQTAGGNMYPWMQSYQGNFTAPMSNEQNQALSGYSNFVGSNPLSGAGSYNQDLLGGRYLGGGTQQIDQIRQGMRGTQQQQDADAQQQIASSMAAGGNALSGARMAANARYQNQSNNNFNTTMGNLEYGNYARERGLQNQGVGQAEGLANTQGNMDQNLMQMGGVPQQLAQHDTTAQYNDWLRQVGAMQQGDQQNTANDLALLRINPGGQNAQYGTSQAAGAAALLSSLFGGSNGSGGSTIGNLLRSLFGGGSQSSSQSRPGGGSSGGGGSNPSPTSGNRNNTNPFATNPDGSPQLGPNGEVLGTDGQPIMGSDGQPITMDADGNMIDSSGYLVDSSGQEVPSDMPGGSSLNDWMANQDWSGSQVADNGSGGNDGTPDNSGGGGSDAGGWF